MVLQGRCCRDGSAGMALQGRRCRDGAAGMALQSLHVNMRAPPRAPSEGKPGQIMIDQFCRKDAMICPRGTRHRAAETPREERAQGSEMGERARGSEMGQRAKGSEMGKRAQGFEMGRARAGVRDWAMFHEQKSHGQGGQKRADVVFRTCPHAVCPALHPATVRCIIDSDLVFLRSDSCLLRVLVRFCSCPVPGRGAHPLI